MRYGLGTEIFNSEYTAAHLLRFFFQTDSCVAVPRRYIS